MFNFTNNVFSFRLWEKKSTYSPDMLFKSCIISIDNGIKSISFLRAIPPTVLTKKSGNITLYGTHTSGLCDITKYSWTNSKRHAYLIEVARVATPFWILFNRWRWGQNEKLKTGDMHFGYIWERQHQKFWFSRLCYDSWGRRIFQWNQNNNVAKH